MRKYKLAIFDAGYDTSSQEWLYMATADENVSADVKSKDPKIRGYGTSEAYAAKEVIHFLETEPSIVIDSSSKDGKFIKSLSLADVAKMLFKVRDTFLIISVAEDPKPSANLMQLDRIEETDDTFFLYFKLIGGEVTYIYKYHVDSDGFRSGNNVPVRIVDFESLYEVWE